MVHGSDDGSNLAQQVHPQLGMAAPLPNHAEAGLSRARTI